MSTRGKTFERECYNAIKNAGGLPERNHDALTGVGSYSVKSLPDLFAFWPNGNVHLIECKAVKGTSIPFNRLAEHQHDHISLFDSYANNFHGGILVNYYNGKRGRERLSRCYYFTINDWELAASTLKRKSMPISEADVYGTEMMWLPREGWQLDQLPGATT